MGILHAGITETKRINLRQHHAITNLTNERKNECLQDKKKKETEGPAKNHLMTVIQTTPPPLRNKTMLGGKKKKSPYFPT
jgi:hypothetical protein